MTRATRPEASIRNLGDLSFEHVLKIIIILGRADHRIESSTLCFRTTLPTVGNSPYKCVITPFKKYRMRNIKSDRENYSRRNTYNS